MAHRGFAHVIFVAEEIAGLKPQPVIDSGIPRVTYCEPEIASVGLTEPQAKEKYGEIETYEYNLGGNGKSQILGTAGIVKLVREKDGPIVGVHMIGTRFGEQVGEADDALLGVAQLGVADRERREVLRRPAQAGVQSETQPAVLNAVQSAWQASM